MNTDADLSCCMRMRISAVACGCGSQLLHADEVVGSLPLHAASYSSMRVRQGMMNGSAGQGRGGTTPMDGTPGSDREMGLGRANWIAK